ncbi:unnamed protein product [Cunninghamella blakesleeana]
MVVLPPLFAQTNKFNHIHHNNQLPSIKTICQDVLTEKPKEMKQNKHLLPSLLLDDKHQQHRRNHFRTSSMPTRLMETEPSLLTNVKKEERLSMEVLLKAISLEQKMNASFKKERVKNFVREQQWLHKVNMKTNQGFVIKKKTQPTSSMARRRSRSAPGAPLAHYYHNASLNPTRWYLPKNHSDNDHYKSTHDIAQAIVQQHLKAVFEKRF